MSVQQLTKEQAIALYQGDEWRDWTDEEVVKVQLYQEKVCLPFGRFHEAIEHILGRGVYTHEFMDADALRLYRRQAGRADDRGNPCPHPAGQADCRVRAG